MNPADQILSQSHASQGALREAVRPIFLGGRRVPRIMTVAVYCDDSFLSGGPVYSFGAYLSDLDTFDHILAPKWKQAIIEAPHKISEFKTSDCRQGSGEFSGWTREQRGELTRRVVSIITEDTPSEGLIGYGSVVVSPGSWSGADGDAMDHNGFGVCFLDTLQWASVVARNVLDDGERLQLVFDKKPKYYSLVAKYFTKALDELPPEFAKRVEYPLFEDSKEVEALQAADLLAYETMKETKSRVMEPSRPVSRALQRLVEARWHLARCVTYDQLKAISDMKAAGIEKPVPWPDELKPMTLFASGTPWRSPTHWPFRYPQQPDGGVP
jgi:uncharacterized protein DUF3800